MQSTAATTLANDLQSHDGWTALEEFGSDLKLRPLDGQQLRLFLASTSTFFREIPAGILALALRVTDDWMERDRFGAVSRGARILLSAVDEYGLHDTAKGFEKSHHELFLDMVKRWNIEPAELENPVHILPEARELARATRDYYRTMPIAEAVGFHFASEKTSDREFQLCMQGFSRFWQVYDQNRGRRETDREPPLNFYYIHTIVEPMHGSTSAEVVEMYASHDRGGWDRIVAGATAFMESYGKFWTALRLRILTEKRDAHGLAVS